MPSSSNRRKYFPANSLILLLLIALFITNGCGAYPGVMSGNWLIALTPSVSLDQILATANLRQSGNQITGTVAFTGAGTSCRAETSVSGSLQGNTLNLLFIQSQGTANLTGTVNISFTSGSGAYSTGGSSCFEALGPGLWSAVFISN